MIAFVWMLLLAASTSVELVNEVYRIPPHEWRYVELGLKQRSAVVSAKYQVEEGSEEVRLALMRAPDMERLRQHEPYDVLTVTPSDSSGRILHDLRDPGDYVIVVENRSGDPAAVHLQIWLDFSRRGPLVTRLSPERQWTVVLISFAVFFAIVSYSARLLLRGIKRPQR